MYIYKPVILVSMMDMENVIVTRHGGLVSWLNRNGIGGKVIEHATPENVRGKVVYGVLPLHLAAEAELIWTIDMPDLPAEKRGVDLTPDEMDQYGATMVGYVVERVK